MYAIVIVGGRAEEARGTREDYGGEQQKNRGSSEETGKSLEENVIELTIGDEAEMLICILKCAYESQAEERLAMVEEQRLMEEERQKMRKEHEKRVKEEQKKILGKNNSRPKLSFTLKSVT